MAQLLQYNCTLRRIEATPYKTPYVGLLSTCKNSDERNIIDKLVDSGLSIPYNHVIEMCTNLGDHMIAQCSEENVVCPSSMRNGIFTTSAVDNIDHNPLQQQPILSIELIFLCFNIYHLGLKVKNIKKLLSLPESYASVPPVIFPKNDPVLTDIYESIPRNSPLMLEATETVNMQVYNHCTMSMKLTGICIWRWIVTLR